MEEDFVRLHLVKSSWGTCLHPRRTKGCLGRKSRKKKKDARETSKSFTLLEVSLSFSMEKRKDIVLNGQDIKLHLCFLYIQLKHAVVHSSQQTLLENPLFMF
jgi:hypothetical protein